MSAPGLIKLAISIIEAIIEDEKNLDKINKASREIYGDFSPELQLMTPCVHSAVVKLLDEILGEGLASYYLYECVGFSGGGMITEKGGTEWPLKTIKNLRNYAYHIHGVEKC